MTLTEVEIEPSDLPALAKARQREEPVRRYAAGPSVTGAGPLAVLETAAKRTRSERSLKSEHALDTAADALRAAAVLAAHEGGRYRHVAQLEEMRLRTEFIAEMGSRPGHPVLDSEIVVRWFLDELPIDARTAHEQVAQMEGDQPLGVDEFRTLRQIKSRLTFVQQLSTCGALAHHPELDAWLKIYSLLP